MSADTNDFGKHDLYETDPSITDETLTTEVLRELAGLKLALTEAILPYWTSDFGEEARAGHTEILALELNGLTPDFIRALAEALKAPVSV